MNRFFCILSHVAEALFDFQCQEIFTHFFTFSRLKFALGLEKRKAENPSFPHYLNPRQSSTLSDSAAVLSLSPRC
ncbi:unnamed protein product [Citrullus colocynthis]|uniref:Uncharacterized protein n=1 Tax=Citrullus colocynthis TaxID=252529 RepID=A0ABP0XSW3_9ROSI